MDQGQSGVNLYCPLPIDHPASLSLLALCLKDSVTGLIRVERGEQIVFPTAYEEAVDPGVCVCVWIQVDVWIQVCVDS